jgi:uncharacterized metal-binding protein
MQEKENVCKGGPKLIFACSGAAGVGEIGDRTARKMNKEDVSKMFCMAGVGGRVEPIMQKAQAASKILAIDGCPLNCTKSCLEQAGFNEFKHLQLADLGLEKGKSPAFNESISAVTAKGVQLLE